MLSRPCYGYRRSADGTNLEIFEEEAEVSSVVDDTGLNLQLRGIDQITLDGVVLAFAAYCKGQYFKITYSYNTELKLMCERNNIHLAKHQVIVNEPPVIITAPNN